MASGTPLAAAVRETMEPRFGTDFGAVRVHRDDRAGRLAAKLRARAFTIGPHIFFGRGEYRPEREDGAELIAHELTHTIQQGAVERPAETSPGRAGGSGTPVRQQADREVHRLGIGDALDYFAERAYLIMGFRMFTLLIGINPINMSRVDRTAANLLRALVELLPGGGFLTQALDAHGVFDTAGAWVEQQLKTLGLTGRSIRNAIDRFLDGLSWTDITRLGAVWEDAKRIFTEPIERVIDFGASLIQGILDFIRDAILQPLAERASETDGWDLLCAVIGTNPITGDDVPRTAENMIGGFMKLIGQEEVWENIKKGNAVERAWAWFQGALEGLVGFVREIPTLFIQALKEIEVADIILIPRAFAKVAGVFAGFAVRFISWAGEQVLSLLEIIFEVVAPQVMVYVRRAGGALRTIIENPIGFVGNLVAAGKLGFRQFKTKFVSHLRASLIGWLTGAMSGANLYIPQGLNLQEILKFVLSVLGLTWQNIRTKLVRVIGEPAVAAMETGFDLVMTLVREGPAAAWQQILESVGNLRDMVIEQVITFVRNRVVVVAVTKLVSMLNPAGAFIQAIIATYNTVMFFVERLQQIARVAMAFIDSIAAIANGVLTQAANRVERTMAGMLTLVISFLARFAGLGNVSQAISRLIDRVRQPIDQGLDRVVSWIVAQARRLGRFVAQAGVPQDPNERLRLGMRAAVAAANRFAGSRVGEAVLRPLLAGIKTRYGFTTLEPVQRGAVWAIRGQINPEDEKTTDAQTGEGGAPSAVQVLASGSWIQIAASGDAERVTSPQQVIRRAPGGGPRVPVSFQTVDLQGRNQSRQYSGEGSVWQRTNFSHGSNLVTLVGTGSQFVLKPEYRGREYIRPNFYEDTQSSRNQIKRSKLPSLLHPNDSTQFLSEGSVQGEAGRGYTTTFNGKAVVPVADASPDHDPPIAEHWTNRQGNNMNQGQRTSWNGSLGTYKIMSARLNSQLGSRGATYTANVGANFLGPSE